MAKKRSGLILFRLWQLWSIIYFILLFYVVFFAKRRPGPHLHGTHIEPQLIPFRHKWLIYRFGGGDSMYLDILGNIVMFVPYSLFLFIVFKVRNYWLIAFSAFCFSFLIELTQFVFGVGQPDIDDLMLNTLGALLGILVIDGVRKYS